MDKESKLESYSSRRGADGVRAAGRSAVLLGLALAAVVALPAAGLHGASSIFDDDWKPPPESAKPKPAAPAKPPPDEPAKAVPRLPPPAEPAPVPSPPVNSTPSTPTLIKPASPARAPLPNTTAIAAAEKVVKEVFKTEYARKASAELIAFSRTLLSEAQQSRNDSATLYVLLRDARDLAVAGGEPEVAIEAARSMRDNFQLDARAAKEMEQSALTTAIRVMCNAPAAIATYEVSHRASDLGMEMAERDLAEGDYAGAAQISATAEMAAHKTMDWEYPNRVHSRVTWLQAIDAEFEPSQAAIASLKTNAADPAANLAAGRFEFVFLDKPDAGLPLLAKGSDATLKTLALKDLAIAAGPGSTAAQLAAADAWVDAAKAEPTAIKDAMQRRALFLYDQAIPNLRGLELASAQKRYDELRQSRVQRGLTAEFFRGEHLSNRAFIRTDSFIAYDWSNVAPEISVPREHFSARWTGWIKAAPGTYKLIAIHDDGVRVWVDGQLVIDRWQSHGRDAAPVQFTGRLQPLKVEFCQGSGPSNLGLGWIAPGAIKAKAVPDAALFHDPIPPGPAIQPYARPQADGRILLPYGAAITHGPLISFSDEPDRECIAFWKDINDWVNWDLIAPEGTYSIDVEYACLGKSAGSSYVVSIGSNRLTDVVAGTGGWGDFHIVRLGQVHLGAGLSSLRIKPTAKPGEAVMNLRSVILTPVMSN